MQGFIEFPDNPPFSPTICEVAKGLYAPLIHPEEAGAVTESCNNGLRKNIITCKDEGRQEFIDEVEGLEMNISLTSLQQDLPHYIPMVDYNIVRDDYPINYPVVGISLRDIFSESVTYKARTLQEQANLRVRTTMGLSTIFKNNAVVLFNSGPDALLETVWHKRNESKFYNQIAELGFLATTGFNFSVFQRECAFAQALNIKRSLYSAYELGNSGNMPIPHIYAVISYQLKRWIAWLLINPGVRYCTMNCQMQKSATDVLAVIGVVKALLKSVPTLHIILEGFKFSQIYQFGPLLNRIHFTDKVPAKSAQLHKETIINPHNGIFKRKYIKNGNKKQLLQKNVMIREQYVKQTATKFLAEVTK